MLLALALVGAFLVGAVVGVVALLLVGAGLAEGSEFEGI